MFGPGKRFHDPSSLSTSPRRGEWLSGIFDALADFFVSRPTRLIDLGRVLAWLAAALAFATAVGHLAVTASAAITQIGGTNSAVPALADVFPGIPTWWIPQSIPAFLLVAAILAAGIACISTGRKLKRILNF